MRLTATEKYEIIQQVTRSELGVKRTLEEYGIARSTFYKWYQSYLEQGFDGLKPKQRLTNRQWNSIPDSQIDPVVELALEYPELSSRELALKITDEQGIYLSESSVYRILKQMHRLFVSYNACGKTYATYKMLRIPRHDTQNVKLS